MSEETRMPEPEHFRHVPGCCEECDYYLRSGKEITVKGTVLELCGICTRYAINFSYEKWYVYQPDRWFCEDFQE